MVKIKSCNDTRKCFAKKNGYCTILEKTYQKDGMCPFAKPIREVTKRKTYTFNPYGLEKGAAS